ncbi:MAG: ABC transporter ATP-binding protein, partial [Chloroflexi bacterium]|nr:ABC transporter ATP-binding protein [Chloroflexota bacterium]
MLRESRDDGVILRVNGLRTHFFTQEGVVKAVNGVTFALRRGTILALVGESGCGKTVTALSILRLLPYPGRIIEGEVVFDGRDMTLLSKEEMRRIRGQEISMIFQDPLSGLNPVLPVGSQVEEIITSHLPVSRKEARRHALQVMAEARLNNATEIFNRYPFQLSGGMGQRVMIAIAMALRPRVLIADEPTSALDVTIQAQILEEIRELKEKLGSAVILITHDMGVV